MTEIAGLQVFAADGKVMLDVTTKFARIIGTQTTSKNNGSVSLGTEGTPFFFVHRPVYGFTYQPIFELSGRTLNWTYAKSGAGTNRNVTFTYGVFV